MNWYANCLIHIVHANEKINLVPKYQRHDNRNRTGIRDERFEE
jgi:hypothetical protein